MGCGFSARIKSENPSRNAVNLTHDSIEYDCSLGGSNKVTHLKMFTYNELKTATRNFHPHDKGGEGGFGIVFRGSLDEQTLAPTKPGTGIAIAMEQLNQYGSRGNHEWLLHHPNLVKLIGYCLDDEHQLLVYEFLTKGSLDNHLFLRKSHAEPLSWSNSMKIALDAAKVLAFSHGDEVNVAYRDLKAADILLDSNFNAKLSDFGLAEEGPSVSTRVIGISSYATPECIMGCGCGLSKKSDVYTFGVVLLELMSGKPVWDRNRQDGERNLVEWVKPYLLSEPRVLKFMDARINGQ